MNELDIFYANDWVDVYDNIKFEKYSYMYTRDAANIRIDSCEVYIDDRLVFDYGKDDIILIDYILESTLWYICYNLALQLNLTFEHVHANVRYKQHYR